MRLGQKGKTVRVLMAAERRLELLTALCDATYRLSICRPGTYP